MKVILTGAAGFIGSCFLWKLNTLGIDQAIIVDAFEDISDNPNLKRKKFKAYLSREELLSRLDQGQLTDTDLVVHLGACADTTEMNRDFLSKNNLEYSKTLCKWALGKGKKFHYASSAAIYGDGKKGYDDADNKVHEYKALNPYGDSKLHFDQWIVDESLASRVVGYRYFNVFGPNEYHKGEMRSMVSKAFDQIQATGRAKLFATTRPQFTDGSEERDFVYIKDVVKVMSYFVENPDRNGIFNVGTGQARTFKDLVTAVFDALKLTPAIDFIPMPEKLRGQYQYFTQAEVSRLRQGGFNEPFFSLEEAVRDYVVTHLQKADPHL